jgi:hypothetical protein
MGSDVWQGEIRCLYFTVASNDFPQLLEGRDFRKVVLEEERKVRTLHISSEKTISGHSFYQWETNSASCSVNSDDSCEHVIVIFSAD